MFALMTVYWIVSVVVTFLQAESWNNIVTACFGSDSTFFCVVRELQTNPVLVPGAVWLVMSENILFVNVSTVHYRVPPSYPHIIGKHPPCTESTDPSLGTSI
jgi:hypothetical protein